LNDFDQDLDIRGCRRSRVCHVGLRPRVQRFFGRLRRVWLIDERIRIDHGRHERDRLDAGRIWLRRGYHGLDAGWIRFRHHGLNVGWVKLGLNGLNNGRLRFRRLLGLRWLVPVDSSKADPTVEAPA